MSFVLDNSVAVAWCSADEQTPAVMELLDRLTETGALAPLLWPLEALNALLAAERRGRLEAAKRERLAGFLRDLPVALDAETAAEAWNATLRMADRHGLSMYDAAYLELAARRNLPLATRDRALRTAAAAIGLDLLGE